MSHDSAEHDGHECEEHETPWERVQSALALVRFDALHSVSYEYEALERLHKLVGGYVSPADARKPLTERTWQGWASTVLGVGWRTMLMRPRGQLTDPSERLTMVDWRTIPLQGYEALDAYRIRLQAGSGNKWTDYALPTTWSLRGEIEYLQFCLRQPVCDSADDDETKGVCATH